MYYCVCCVGNISFPFVSTFRVCWHRKHIIRGQFHFKLRSARQLCDYVCRRAQNSKLGFAMNFPSNAQLIKKMCVLLGILYVCCLHKILIIITGNSIIQTVPALSTRVHTVFPLFVEIQMNSHDLFVTAVALPPIPPSCTWITWLLWCKKESVNAQWAVRIIVAIMESWNFSRHFQKSIPVCINVHST